MNVQQGRVQTDSDWKEQVDICQYLLRTLARDLVGPHGGPPEGFKILGRLRGRALRHDFAIHAGHYFVDGVLCKNGSTRAYTSQPDHPVQKSRLEGAGSHLVYLDVRERDLAHFEDPGIREVALAGPDTTTRGKTAWRVGVLPLGTVGKNGPNTDVESVLKNAVARADTTTLVPETGGYQGPESRLYCVEIHNPSSDSNGPTFKWSRENGSVASPILRVNGGPNDECVELEDGIKVKFSAGTYLTGDYWLIPARTATKSVIWPTRRGKPVPMPPCGMGHHYCPLAIVTYRSNGVIAEILDQRRAIEIFDDLSNVEDMLTYYQELIAADGHLGRARKRFTTKKM